MKTKISFLTLLAISTLSCVNAVFSQGVYFDSSNPDTLILGNISYEAGFEKLNGNLLYIYDTENDDTISTGTKFSEGIWKIYFSDNSTPSSLGYLGASYGTFSYSLDAGEKTLTFDYIKNPANPDKYGISITVTASENSYIDFDLHVTNESSKTIKAIGFPNYLTLPRQSISEVLIPDNPGKTLDNTYSDSGDIFSINYYPALLANFYSFKINNSFLSLYTLWQPDTICILQSGYKATAIETDKLYLVNDLYTWPENGSSYNSPTVRANMAQFKY